MKVTRNMVREMRELDSQIKALQAELKELQEAVKAEGVNRYEWSDGGLNVYESEKATFARKAFEKAHPEMIDLLNEYTTVSKFLVTRFI